MGGYQARVLSHHIKLSTKLKVYTAGSTVQPDVWMRISDPVQEAHQTAREIPRALLADYHSHTLARQGDKRGCPGPVRLQQHGGNDHKGPASMDKLYDPDG
ncbi:hypothetical protein BaRGS_00018702 [Batillaria attramentaria]|uniref:Uncharacterized protein n=1 Tax=Batillaria attramentaria TaxID=370345 RepID=A0ABD0KTA0_9CAEN